LLIPQSIDEHGEPWWNDIDRGKLLIRSAPAELSSNPTNRHLVAEQDKLAKDINFALRMILFLLRNVFDMP